VDIKDFEAGRRATNPMTPEIERKLIGYATEFIKGYSEALDNNYPDVTREIRGIGLGNAFFPLYHRELGKGIQLAVLPQITTSTCSS
jgi:hypothetical protein